MTLGADKKKGDVGMNRSIEIKSLTALFQGKMA